MDAADQSNSGKETITFHNRWYEHNASYWVSQPATVDGMLGGFGSLSGIDCKASIAFIRSCIRSQGLDKKEKERLFDKVDAEFSHLVAADCGAGIGRVSQNVLLKLFGQVDLVERDAHFVEKAQERLKVFGERMKYHVVGMENFLPSPNTYDVIWIQWCIVYLTDNDLVKFLINCRKSLKEDGFIGLKENESAGHIPVEDKDDSSVTRTHVQMLDIFAKAGLKIARQEQQQGFPASLFPVLMYCLVSI